MEWKCTYLYKLEIHAFRWKYLSFLEQSYSKTTTYLINLFAITEVVCGDASEGSNTVTLISADYSDTNKDYLSTVSTHLRSTIDSNVKICLWWKGLVLYAQIQIVLRKLAYFLKT